MHAVNKHNTCSHTYPVNKHKTCCFQELPSLHLYVYMYNNYICSLYANKGNISSLASLVRIFFASAGGVTKDTPQSGRRWSCEIRISCGMAVFATNHGNAESKNSQNNASKWSLFLLAELMPPSSSTVGIPIKAPSLRMAPQLPTGALSVSTMQDEGGAAWPSCGGKKNASFRGV